MPSFTLVRRVHAPPDRVFAVFSDFRNAPRYVPGIERVEILTPSPIGVGSRVRETRRLGRRTSVADLEITRWEPGEGYVVVSESGGYRMSTACLVTNDVDGSKVDVALDCTPRGLLARWKVRLLLPAIRREMERDLDALKAAAEAPDAAATEPPPA